MGLTKYMMIGIGFLLIVCGVMAWRVDSLQNTNTTLRTQLMAQAVIIDQHEKNVKITEEVSHGYQSDINKLNASLSRLRKRPAKCIAITSSTSSDIKPATKPKLSDGDGLSTEWLYDYAGRAEQTRITLLACQNFINRVKEGK